MVAAGFSPSVRLFEAAAGGTAPCVLNAANEGAVRAFLDGLRCHTLAESLGGVESLVNHPAIMTHASLPPEKRAALGIGLRQLQTLQGDLVIVRSQRPFLQKLFGFFGSFRRIASQHPLVKDLGRRKRRPVAEHDVKEFQTLDMTPKYHKANCQWCGKYEPNRPP